MISIHMNIERKIKQQRDSDPNYTVLHLQYSHYRHLQAQHCSTLYMPCKPLELVQLYPSDQGDVDGTLQQNNEITFSSALSIFLPNLLLPKILNIGTLVISG